MNPFDMRIDNKTEQLFQRNDMNLCSVETYHKRLATISEAITALHKDLDYCNSIIANLQFSVNRLESLGPNLQLNQWIHEMDLMRSALELLWRDDLNTQTIRGNLHMNILANELTHLEGGSKSEARGRFKD